jgi:hypothetical protein
MIDYSRILAGRQLLDKRTQKLSQQVRGQLPFAYLKQHQSHTKTNPLSMLTLANSSR